MMPVEPAKPMAPAGAPDGLADRLADRGGLWRWLGRQVGYVRAAIRTDVTGAKVEKRPAVFRQQRVQEQSLGGQPPVTLRRTTVDEVIVEPPARSQQSPLNPDLESSAKP
jgi:hypothetical protein